MHITGTLTQNVHAEFVRVFSSLCACALVENARLCHVGWPPRRELALPVVDPLAVEIVQGAEFVAEAFPPTVHLFNVLGIKGH